MEIQKLPSYPERRLHFLHLPRQTGTFSTLSLPDIPTVTATSQGSDTGTGTASATQDTQSGDTQSPSQTASTPAPTSNPPSGSSSNVQSATDSSSDSVSPSATPSPTPTPTPTPTTSDTTSTPQSSSSSDTPTPSSSSPTPTPTPTSTSSPSPSTTDPASSSSPSTTSGVSLTTFTSSFVSEINGTPTTIVTPIVTALNTSQPHSAAAARRTGIIAASAIGGATLLILALAALFYVRRRASKQTQRYAALARKPPPSRAAFLAGEDMDGPSAARYDDARYGDGGWDGGRYGDGGDGGRYELPPRLFHASESGSVFQEAVWPPPIPLADPLASGADLARIVDDVMGPSNGGSGAPPSRLRGGSWDADHSYDSIALLQAEHAQDRSYDSLAMRVGPQHDHNRDTSVSSQTGLLPFARSPLTLTLANPDAAGPATPPASAKPWLDRAPEPKHSDSVGQAL